MAMIYFESIDTYIDEYGEERVASGIILDTPFDADALFWAIDDLGFNPYSVKFSRVRSKGNKGISFTKPVNNDSEYLDYKITDTLLDAENNVFGGWKCFKKNQAKEDTHVDIFKMNLSISEYINT